MEYKPVGRRTRLQRALEKEKFNEVKVAKRELWKKEEKGNGGNYGVYSSDDDDDDDGGGDACMLIDESEFLKGVSARSKFEENSQKEVLGVAKVSKFGKFFDGFGGKSKGFEEKGKGVMNDDGVNDDHDDGYGNASVPMNDVVDDDVSVYANNVDNVDVDVVDDVYDDDDGVSDDVNDDDGVSDNVNDDGGVSDDVNDDIDRVNDDGGVSDGVSDDVDGGGGGDDDVNDEGEFRRKVFEGMILPAYLAKSNGKEDDFVGKRTRSHYKHNAFPRKNTRDGTISKPITIDLAESSSSLSSPSSSDDEEGEEVTDLKAEAYEKSREVVKRKRGRPPKKEDNKVNEPKARVKRQKTSEVQNVLMNVLLEHSNVASGVSSVSEVFLPLKFQFGVENVQPKISEEEQEIDCLFKEMDFALGVCDIGSQTSCVDDNEDESASLDKALCHGGKKHYWIQDDEIGIKCKFCSIVKLEIRHVMPDFNEDPFGKSKGGNRYYDQFPYDSTNFVSDKFQFPDYSYDGQGDPIPSDATQGTVWDLIPGTRKTLYPHQRDAFEFIWKNIGGGIRIDELGKLTGSGTGGCIICHAPGTGKTRLAIVFLQSFMKKYPNSKPVILAPYSMLRTWEEEFGRWNVDIPFYNLNEKELSGKEDCQLLKICTQQSKTVKDENITRFVKLETWKKGKSVLAVSYGLFQRLAQKSKGKDTKGRHKGVDEKDRKLLDKMIRQALLEQPDILVLDEGHTPRNENSSIFKLLSKVTTKRRVMLTGTPFQNNFEELHNTIALVREEFGVLFSAQLSSDDRKIEIIRKHFQPFVHVHKGEILKETLPGLFHSLIVLRPSELQKLFFARVATIRSKFMKFDNLISITSVHPSIFCNKETDFITKENEALLEKYKNDLDAGVKTRFLVELIKLCKGERVLVFGQYLPPLNFIGDLLNSLFQWTKGRELLYIYGNQDMKERQSLIELFNDPSSEARVLLASTKACCEGISLVGASRVVLLDVVWNPSVERQAISRAYRLRQKKDVFVYHLITSGTLEEEKYRRQAAKERFGELLFSSSSPSVEGGTIDKKSIESKVVSRDHILEELIQHDKTKYMFEKIICQPKTDDLITSFGPRDL